MNAHNLCQRIAAMHAAPEWATLFEVRDGAGWDRRTADAVAMNLWKSRGLTLRGFEVKISRGDLRREHADPAKAEGVAKFCDEWWLVTPKGLVKDVAQDVPVGWGIMEADPDGAGLVTVRAATRNQEPAALTRGFMAQVLKGAVRMVSRENHDWVRREDIAAEIAQAFERGQAMVPREAQLAKDRAAKLEQRIAEFARLTGINLTDDYRNHVDPKRAAKAYKLGCGLLGEYENRIPLIIRELEGLGNIVKATLSDLAPLKEQIDAAGAEPKE
jgi:hypothetical protein